jgi:hypothetical protein
MKVCNRYGPRCLSLRYDQPMEICGQLPAGKIAHSGRVGWGRQGPGDALSRIQRVVERRAPRRRESPPVPPEAMTRWHDGWRLEAGV